MKSIIDFCPNESLNQVYLWIDLCLKYEFIIDSPLDAQKWSNELSLGFRVFAVHPNHALPYLRIRTDVNIEVSQKYERFGIWNTFKATFQLLEKRLIF